MKIIRVTYRELKSFGNFNNASVEATAEVHDGESPGKALEDLKAWVKRELLGAEEADRLTREMYRMRDEVRYLEGKLQALKNAEKSGATAYIDDDPGMPF